MYQTESYPHVFVKVHVPSFRLTIRSTTVVYHPSVTGFRDSRRVVMGLVEGTSGV